MSSFQDSEIHGFQAVDEAIESISLRKKIPRPLGHGSLFWQVFKFYNKPFRGLFYMPARWAIVPFAQIESYLPKKGLVIDVGCGEGVLTTLLAIKSPHRKVLGIDIDRGKINLAKEIAQKVPNLSFNLQDAMSHLPRAHGITLSDFLHHLSKNLHRPLLRKLTSSLDKGGTMIIKEIDLKDGIRARISRLFDFIFYPGQRVNFISSHNLTSTLTELGLKVRIIKVKKWFPGSTTLFICKK